jgi:type IV pilus assembly protein PilB
MKALDERLIESGLVSKSEVEQAKAVQRKSGFKLVEYLRRQGSLNENELMDFITRQLKVDKYTPEKYPFDEELKELIPEETVRKRHVVPLKRENGMLLVATDDPMNIHTLDSVEQLTKLAVEPVYCPRQELEELIYTHYGGSTDLGDMLGTLEELGVETEGDKEEGVEDISAASLKNKAEEAPVIRLVNQILAQAAQEKASDVHVSPQKNSVQLRFRIDGQLKEFPGPPKSVFMPVVSRIKLLANMDIAVTRVPQDGRFAFQINNREINVRASTLPTIYGENVVLRLLTRSPKGHSLDDLGMIEEDRDRVEAAIHKSYGMILATGPTGSGKTTLLYSILQRIDKPNINIVTLEDPVEYRIDTIRQVQLNRKAGMTFAGGLRSILRQDPDVIMVGEIRDRETAHIGVESAMTGHKMLSTVHTNDAAGATTRLVDMGIEPFLVASTLLAAVGQRLVRRICSNCMEPHEPPAQFLKILNNLPEVRPQGDLTFYHGKGCPQCGNTGFRGRTGIYECLLIDELVQELIMKGASSKEISRAAVKAGTFRTMQMDAMQKVLEGVTTLEEAAPIIFM